MILRTDFFKNAKWDNIRVNLTALLLYVFLTMILTFPLILHMDRYLDPGDSALNTWILAWDVHSLSTDPLNLFNTNAFYPYNNTLAFSEHLIADMLIAFPAIIISHNPILAYNLILFLSFILTGFGMFLLINYYIKNTYSSFLGGVIFAFCTIRFAHIGHLQLLTIQWLPFALLYLDKFLHKCDYKNLAILYLFCMMQILSSWYHAFYLTITLGIYTLLLFIIDRDLRNNIFQNSFQIKSILFVISVAIVVAPFAYPYLQLAQEHGFTRTLDEVSFFSADVADYLLTPINNLAYGSIFSSIQSHRNFSEHSLFPGITVIILVFYGLFSLCRLKINDQSKIALIKISNRTQDIYVIILLAAFILTLGTPLHFFGHVLNIDLPYRYLWEYFPGFKSMRVPSRFGFIVMFSLSVLAAYGLSRLIESRSKVKKNIISIIFILLIICESLYIPLFNGTMPIGNEIPEVYQWLANETDDFAIVEIPSELWSDTTYLYYSTYHWKKLVNGYSGFFPNDYSDMMASIMSFPSDKSMYYLKTLGVKYIVVHTYQMNKSELNNINIDILKYENEISLKKVFNSDYVYEINLSNPNIPIKNPLIVGDSGYYSYENWPGISSRWMQADGTISILSPENCSANLRLRAFSFYHPRTLEIRLGDEVGAEMAVPTSFINVSVPLKLKKGANAVQMHVLDGCERPCDIKELNNPDSRCLSVALQNLSIF